MIDPLESPLFGGRLLRDVSRTVMLVFGDALAEVDRQIAYNELTPKHGPGATADRLRGNQKWTFPTWPERMERMFPYREFAQHSILATRDNAVRLLPQDEEIPTRVILVPKTQVTPRIIAAEPTAMQYAQQALKQPLVDAIESHPIASSFVGFEDQRPNQAMAHFASDEGTLATLDLSEASDRVPNWLVEAILEPWPHLNEAVQACRSTRAKLPDGEVIPLLKFASMGSALTFPIEAIVFAAVTLVGVHRAVSVPMSGKSLTRLQDEVRVYGDDIICPSVAAETVIECLEAFGFKVNRHKSFWTGLFRESCGKEYWAGFDVSVTKVRFSFPSSLRDAKEVASAVATRNLFYKDGLSRVVALYDEALTLILKGRFPVVEESSPLLGRLDTSAWPDGHAWCPDYHVPLARGYVVQALIPENEIDGSAAMLKCLVNPGNQDPQHLTRSGRPTAVKLKRSLGPVW
jgi:hypothetical protein